MKLSLVERETILLYNQADVYKRQSQFLYRFLHQRIITVIVDCLDGVQVNGLAGQNRKRSFIVASVFQLKTNALDSVHSFCRNLLINADSVSYTHLARRMAALPSMTAFSWSLWPQALRYGTSSITAESLSLIHICGTVFQENQKNS